jgi:hypothetical protein
MAVLSRDQILGRKLGRETVDVGDAGQVVVRGLTRAEAHDMKEIDGNPEREVRTLALGVVEPELTEDDVRAWMAGATFGELQPVLERIMSLSGMLEGQGKEATKSVPARRRR